jgi:TonB family protein
MMLSSLQVLSQNNVIDSLKLNEQNRQDWSPYGYHKDALLFGLVDYKYTTQITYFDVNIVTERVQSFIQNSLGLYPNGNSDFNTKNKTITFTYIQPYASIGTITRPRKLNIKFNYFINAMKSIIIEKCLVSGDYSLVLDFYINFWPTTIHLQPSKNKVAYSSFWQDKISLSPISTNGTATLTVINGTIKDIADYELQLKKAIKDAPPVKDAPTIIKDAPSINKDKSPVVIESNEPLLVVEQNPEFQGGYEAMLKFLHDKMQYPTLAQESGIQGTVFVQFVVSKTGKISNVKILRGIGGGCDEEAIRITSEMPSWIPARQNGQAVPVMFQIPVKFQLP